MKFSVLKAAFLYAHNRNTCTPGVVMRILGFYKDFKKDVNIRYKRIFEINM